MTSLLWKAAPGELDDLPAEPFTLSDVDFTPRLGGCGEALYRTAQLLTGEDADEATAHLEACPRCREALMNVGTRAAGIDALLYFEALNTETPHAVTPASSAAWGVPPFRPSKKTAASAALAAKPTVSSASRHGRQASRCAITASGPCVST